MYDYGARMLIPDLGRWNGIDQLTENYHSKSPYAYVMNNPLSFTDPDGRQINREERGWSFSGEDIGWAMSYFQNGGSLKALDNALESWNAGRGSFEGNNDNFWTKFEGLNLSLPPVTLTGKIGAVWALQLRNHVNAYMEQWNGQYSARFFEDRVGDQVLPPKKTALGKFWSFISPRIWKEGGMSYMVNYEGIATGIAPIIGDVPLSGPGLKGIITTEGSITKALFATEKEIISSGDFLRIENAATRINKPITVVGSRATGKAKAYSDWDYVIENLNNKEWSKIKNSIPGARSTIDNTPRNIDIFKKLDLSRPYLTIHPR
ncbi:RHS repeat-associated core domain [Chryseobacterium nakagawai]|uniref:RHS repeat-associated core domain n=2 Tax=Chryseobacterium nakagawai TaxID=1241982 RepID=A0AAD0YQV7_CHRNA|nr:RHS repeat-associated core domain-containing protein [Chryseobacterium nakagawai]AZA93477.1 hypothetical protein EG343_24135 [Chryseobacterium nakagawai]VEH20161.1 RHS repeat-associated core domain [Chryseobacterium nakagawai]